MNGFKWSVLGLAAVVGALVVGQTASAKDARKQSVATSNAYGYAERQDRERHEASEGYGSVWYYFSGKIDKNTRQGPGHYYRGLWR